MFTFACRGFVCNFGLLAVGCGSFLSFAAFGAKMLGLLGHSIVFSPKVALLASSPKNDTFGLTKTMKPLERPKLLVMALSSLVKKTSADRNGSHWVFTVVWFVFP